MQEQNLLFVNDHHHTCLTMLSLRAIQPHRCRAGHLDRVDGGHGVGGLDRHESREHSCLIRVQSYRLAGLIEGRLGDSVICKRELELNHISYISLEAVRCICQTAVRRAYFDNVHSGSRG